MRGERAGHPQRAVRRAVGGPAPRDHRGLGARFRFAAHCLAALLVLGWAPIHWAAVGIDLPSGVQLLRIGAFAIAMLAIVWSINLHNFMDGIDGLLAMQALFVFVVLALLCAGAGQFAEAGRIALFAAATLGFLPFNFPRARIFMGDVGSGVLGLLVIVAVGWQMNATSLAWSSGLITCSAFVADATATLLSRILRGRRWYSAHREHLYQWLVRGGRSHVRVVVYYAGWNLLLVVPVLCWINRAQATSGSADGIFSSRDIEAFGAAVVVYAIALLVWFLGKRHCLKMARHRTRDAGA